MRKHLLLIVSIVFASSLLLGTLSQPIVAQEVTRSIAGPTIYSVTETMPEGDEQVMLFAPPSAKLLKRRSPVGESRLDEIKQAATRAGSSALLNSEGEPSGATNLVPNIPQLAIASKCVGNTSTGFTPSDVHGATGPTNFIIVTNVNITIRNKSTCAAIRNQALIAFFNSVGVPTGTTIFDPRVIYDTLSQRFFVTAEFSTTLMTTSINTMPSPPTRLERRGTSIGSP